MNIVLLGGNGYIGRATTKMWLSKDPTSNFYVVSVSGDNKLKSDNIHNIIGDASDYESIIEKLPDHVDYIIDFIGRPEKNLAESDKINNQPAKVMRRIAEEKNVKAMGFIGGILGPKYFVDTKKQIIDYLKESDIKLGCVEPTIAYGDDRRDTLARMIPFFKLIGVFSKKFKPMHVQDIANNLIENILK